MKKSEQCSYSMYLSYFEAREFFGGQSARVLDCHLNVLVYRRGGRSLIMCAVSKIHYHNEIVQPCVIETGD